MKAVYVTGCLGFIGSYITRRCLQRGWHVRGVDKITYAADPLLLDEFKEYENFVFEQEDVKSLNHLYDCDYIINTAAESHVGNSIINSDEFVNSNIVAVKNLLDLIRYKPINISKRPILLHFSTDEVYGDIESGEHMEHDLLAPSNPYSASKAAADMLILAWARTYGVRYIIVRPTNNYGIGQYPEKLIPLTIKKLRKGEKIRLHNNGTPVRSWLHAEDTASAVNTIIDAGTINEIYNISGGFEQTNLETVKSIIKHFHNKENYQDYVDFSYSRPGQDVRYSLNDDKLRNLGWKPEKHFKHEIQAIVEHGKNRWRW